MCHIRTPAKACVEAPVNTMGLFSFPASPSSPKSINYDNPPADSKHKPVAPRNAVAAALQEQYNQLLASISSFHSKDQSHIHVAYPERLRFTPAIPPSAASPVPVPYIPTTNPTFWNAIHYILTIPRPALLHDTPPVSSDLFYSLISDSKLSNHDLARLWHRRLGHPGQGAITHMLKHHPELQFFKPRHLHELLCETCAVNQVQAISVQLQRSFPRSDHLIPRSLRYLGTMFLFISKYTWAYPIQRRSDLYTIYEQFRLDALSLFKIDIDLLHHAQPTDIGTLRSDNAGEYERLARIIYPKYHTRFTFSNAYSPQQNGVAERRIGILDQKIRAMLIEGSLPKFLWATALDYAAWLTNILPSTSNDGQSPYYRVFNTHPSLSYVKTFGCTAFVHIQQEARPSKLDPYSLKTMFVGLPTNRKGYTLMHLFSHQLIYSRDVSFFESEFPSIN
ncbi:hypothetical protein LEN26_017185 [Aphanomyces euteiches]|nr:hypothetical protein LEN26_017185 [Aphanomyces euteiches]KAH9126003.1 hypothetical protein AeMF1_003466 [Aphanomyces euteiches]